MKTIGVIIVVIVISISCREKIVIDSILEDGHQHTHADVNIVGFPTMTIPSDNETTEEGIYLGRKLFYDSLLSGDNTMSCASCHQQSRSFSDNKRFSVGIKGIPGEMNASAIISA